MPTTAPPLPSRQTGLSTQAYKDTEDLIEYYLHRDNFRRAFNSLVESHQTQATFRYRPLKFYISVLAQIDPARYKNDVRYNITTDRTHQIFEQFYENRKDRFTLEHNAIEPHELPAEFNAQVEEIEQSTSQPGQEHEKFKKSHDLASHNNPEPNQPPAEERTKEGIEQDELKLEQAAAVDEAQRLVTTPLATAAAADQFVRPLPLTPPVLPRRRFIFPRIPTPSFVKNGLSRAKIFIARKLATPYIVGALTGILGGFGIGGPVGALVGGIGGAWIANRLVNSTQDQDQSGGSPLSFNNLNPMRSLNPLNRTSPLGRGKNMMTNAAKNMGKRLAKKAAKQLAQKAAVALVANPYFWIIIAIIAFLIGLPILFNLIKTTSLLPPYQVTTSNSTQTQTSAQVTVSKQQQNCQQEQNYCTVENGQDITYVLTATYQGEGSATIEVDDPLPSQTSFKSAPEGDLQGNTVKWTLQNMTKGQPKNLTITITPTANDIWIVNTASANVLSTTGSTSTQAPNNDSCGGKYQINTNPLGNFGDPSCNFTERDLYKALQQSDPANADFWFNVVIPCESSYNPNAYNGSAVDAAGAWGLTQMGRGKNGQFDHGDVSWPQQVTNSTQYQQQINGWNYWACAESRW